MIKELRSWLVAFCIILCSLLFGKEVQMPENPVLKAISENNRTEFFKALPDKKTFERKLVDILKAPGSSEFQKCAAAYVLGREKSVLAIDALTENISLRNSQDWDGSNSIMSSIGEYPAWDALCEIGYPAAKAVAYVLLKTDDKDVIERGIVVLSVIFEHNRDMVKSYLQDYCKKNNIADKSNDYDLILIKIEGKVLKKDDGLRNRNGK